MCAGFISAKNSGFNPAPPISRARPGRGRQRRWIALEQYKQESDQFSLAVDGAHPTTTDPAEPSAGDDAAADAGDQAAATLQSRSGRVCRGRTRAQSAARPE